MLTTAHVQYHGVVFELDFDVIREAITRHEMSDGVDPRAVRGRGWCQSESDLAPSRQPSRQPIDPAARPVGAGAGPRGHPPRRHWWFVAFGSARTATPWPP